MPQKLLYHVSCMCGFVMFFLSFFFCFAAVNAYRRTPNINGDIETMGFHILQGKIVVFISKSSTAPPSSTSTAPESESRSEKSSSAEESMVENDVAGLNKGKGILGHSPNRPNVNTSAKPNNNSSSSSQQTRTPVQENKTRVKTERRSVCTDPLNTKNRFGCLVTCEA